jgi:hypothetical protein
MWHCNNNSIIFNSIDFNSYLFTCKRNSPEANYKVSTSKEKKKKTYKQDKKGSIYSNSNNINNNNSIKKSNFSGEKSKIYTSKTVTISNLIIQFNSLFIYNNNNNNNFHLYGCEHGPLV